MRILALDPGVNFGWAVNYDINSPGNTNSGVQVFKSSAERSNGARLMMVDRWLKMSFGNPELVVVERMFIPRVQTQGGKLLIAFESLVHKYAAEAGSEITIVPPTTLKKWATGSGKASKGDMLKSVVKFQPRDGKGRIREITNDNEADALLLLQYAEEMFG